MRDLIDVTVDTRRALTGDTVWTGEGTDAATGERVRFAGDWRSMRDLAEFLADGHSVDVEVEEWQVLAVFTP